MPSRNVDFGPKIPTHAKRYLLVRFKKSGKWSVGTFFYETFCERKVVEHFCFSKTFETDIRERYGAGTFETLFLCSFVKKMVGHFL